MVNKFEFCKYFENCGSKENCSRCTAFKCSREKLNAWYDDFYGNSSLKERVEKRKTDEDFEDVLQLDYQLQKEEKADEINKKVDGKIKNYEDKLFALKQFEIKVINANIDNKVFNKRITNMLKASEDECYFAYFDSSYNYSTYLEINHKNHGYGDKVSIHLDNTKITNDDNRLNKSYLLKRILETIEEYENNINSLNNERKNMKSIIDDMKAVYDLISKLKSINSDMQNVLGIKGSYYGIELIEKMESLVNCKEYL